MPERISVLCPARDDCPSVTLNVAVNYVQIPNSVAPVQLVNSDPTLNYFQSGDNINLLSMGYYVPAGLAFWGPDGAIGRVSPMAVARLSAYGFTTATTFYLTQFGSNGRVKIPGPNSEISLGGFFNSYDNLGDQKFRLEVEFPFDAATDAFYVSMGGLPPPMNGEVVYIVPFIKVMHTLPMIA